jgi:hypothetical protein
MSRGLESTAGASYLVRMVQDPSVQNPPYNPQLRRVQDKSTPPPDYSHDSDPSQKPNI